MIAQRRAEIEARWRAIDLQLADIAAGRVVADDLASGKASFWKSRTRWSSS